MVILSQSASETIRIGKKIAGFLKPGDVIALTGELGAGKTQLTKGIAAGIGVRKPGYVSSPSFTLINEYEGRIPLYHIDLYRLETEMEAQELGLEEYFRGMGVTVVEWADRIPSLLPNEILTINIGYTGKKTRIIEIIAKGKRYAELLKKLDSPGSGPGQAKSSPE